MMSLLSAAAELLPSIAHAVLPSNQTPNSTTAMDMQPRASSDLVSLSTQPAPSTPSPSPQVTTGSNPGVVIPFQWMFSSIDGLDNSLVSQTFAENTILQKITPHFRDASIVHLEVVAYPTELAMKNPVTLHLAWTSATTTIADGKVLACPGAVSVTLGGLMTLTSTTLPCPLQYVNPIVKGPIAYTNTPKLWVQKVKNSSPPSPSGTLANVIIRGSLRLSAPLLAPH